MSKGKFFRKSGFNVRPLILMLAVALLIGATIGGTIAWLTSTTEKVENTFTVGNINITLEESGADETEADGQQRTFKMVPGDTIDKDPQVSVLANSEACWLFIKVEKSTNLESFITYVMEENWKPLDGHDGVFYREVDAATAAAGVTYDVIGNKGADGTGTFEANKVLVKTSVTKEMMDGLTDATLPKLTFTAYAIQKANIADVATAWAEVSK